MAASLEVSNSELSGMNEPMLGYTEYTFWYLTHADNSNTIMPHYPMLFSFIF